MSLMVARSIATSALITAQTRMSVAAANVANADSEGYTRKVATQTAQSTAGVGTGVAVTSIASTVDKYLLASLVAADTRLGAAETTASYTDRLQALYGTVSSTDDEATGTSLANTIADLTDALTQLSGTPESATLQAQVVDDLDAVASQLRSTSDGIQSLRSDADQEIETTVDEINQALATIDDLNDRIVAAKAAGVPTGDLEDARTTALETVASAMDVTSFTDQSGALKIYTASGRTLLDGTVHALSYSSATTVTADTRYPGGFSGIVVDGVDITTQISGGSIGALITLRDETLPDAQADLDGLAVSLADALNAAHNQGTAVPAPSSLGGTTVLDAGDGFSATGTARFAVVDADGKLVASADIDLSTITTVGDLVDAIDAVDGLSASLDADGHLVVTADDADTGVAVGTLTSSVGDGGQGLSDWLGLNDLVTATGASDFSVRSDILANESRLAVSTLDESDPLTVGDTVLPTGSMAVADALVEVFESTHDFAAAGNLGSTTTTFASYASQLVAAVASTAASAESELGVATSVHASATDAVSSQSGVNVDEETALIDELQSAYQAAAQIVSVLNEMFEALLDMVQ